MIKVPISQQGQAVTYIASTGALYHDGEGIILIYVHERVEQPGLAPTVDVHKFKPMQVDDTTRLPAVLRQVAGDGTETFAPILREELRPATDEAGNPLFVMITVEETGETYPDYSQPVMVAVEVPRTVGEYQAVKWWHWDHRNPAPQPSIEEMIEEGIRRKVGLSAQPYHFEVTPEFLAAFGDNW